MYHVSQGEAPFEAERSRRSASIRDNVRKEPPSSAEHPYRACSSEQVSGAFSSMCSLWRWQRSRTSLRTVETRHVAQQQPHLASARVNDALHGCWCCTLPSWGEFATSACRCQPCQGQSVPVSSTLASGPAHTCSPSDCGRFEGIRGKRRCLPRQPPPRAAPASVPKP